MNSIRIKWPTGQVEARANPVRIKGQLLLTAEGKAQARAMRQVLGIKSV
ncbi:hypothetical protein CPT_Percy4 [Caulobacter phage Percy]|uniref:Uncharacterized protein n=1 Tax=Caulobacter phage Percy TaxID=1701809 RepID=A0A0M4RDG2_9CAUD|nr:hypothetical protein CPT_Percy4 [Caulobacter phage Percy]ALF01638.1 hypothetical protein CPT_Percy4 [Caulobacter phage Percy]